MKNFSIIIIVVILLASCGKKTRSIAISGNIFDPALKIPVENTKVILKASKIEGGIYNPNYVEIASATTDISGNYEMNINIEKVSGYRFVIEKTNYFSSEEDIKTDILETNSTYSYSKNIFPIASIHLMVSNKTPQSMDDEIKYRYTNIESQCKTCCNNNPITGTGPSYSADSQCDTRCETWINLVWVVTKNGIQHLYQDSIFTHAFQTSNYKIDY